MKKHTTLVGLVVFVLVCLGTGGLGALATTPEIDGWYQTIAKPTWSPPGYVFGPVWTALYILMTTVAFFGRSKAAGWLMIPYLAWVSFASVLNFVIWRMNL